jgi:molybdopterin-guanine dinucleotide biosynthesis protein B
MPPVISIVGKSKSGKTTLIEKLVGELKSRGYRVATIKHAPKGVSFGEPDKDSWRHLKAGSEATAVSSPDRIVLMKPLTEDAGLNEVARLVGEDYDIILAEGFKQEGAPKIEVHRQAVGPPLSGIRKVIAIATDETLATKTRQFALEDIKGLADLLEQGFIRPQRQRLVLYVNGVPIPLSSFPRDITASVVMALASSMKGVGEVRSLELLMKREPPSKEEGRDSSTDSVST